MVLLWIPRALPCCHQANSILRMPRGASPSPCIPELALERLALVCGDPTMPFQGRLGEQVW